MKNLFILSVVAMLSLPALAESSVSKITCSPTVGAPHFLKETIEIVLDRSNYPIVSASFTKVSDRYSDFVDSEVLTGNLMGNDYFEVVTLKGRINDEFQNSYLVKFKIHNGVLRFVDPRGLFVETKPFDDREWNCTETATP